ncbi:MAG TPA: 2Fe-2S iron-sulfur cluster-binding protein, partial [Desulfurivibrionaceae bacterium]|nr:2Fe-2S iron-sulfur cluster-binding protein [Desulfurivibrionaceae bacterium]
MADETSTARVTFLPSGRTVEVKPGETIIKAARQAGIHINASCGGSGVCGKCRVLIEQGEVVGGRSEKLSEEEFGAGWRQACTAEVREVVTVRIPATSGIGKGGLTTEVPQRHRARMHVYNIEDLREAGIFQPPVEKFFLELPRPAAHDNMADAGRILQGLSNQYDEHGVVISLPVLRKVPEALRTDDFRVTATIANPVRSGKKYMMDVQPGNWT